MGSVNVKSSARTNHCPLTKRPREAQPCPHSTGSLVSILLIFAGSLCRPLTIGKQEASLSSRSHERRSPSGQAEDQSYWWYRGLPSCEKTEADTGRN